MVNKCCVPGCTSNYKSMKKGAAFKSVTVFTFPKNEQIKNEWIRKIPRDLIITKYTVVCIKHFEEDDVIHYKAPINKNSAKVSNQLILIILHWRFIFCIILYYMRILLYIALSYDQLGIHI